MWQFDKMFSKRQTVAHVIIITALKVPFLSWIALKKNKKGLMHQTPNSEIIIYDQRQDFKWLLSYQARGQYDG